MRQINPDYENIPYMRCGKSGLKLPAISLGLWHNFGGVDVYETARQMVWEAFESGITHFDLANNYGPPYGSAETTFGRILKQDLMAHRDEMIISTKAGYDMWPGPYGNWGSRKYLIASLDQSLRRLGIDYVDIFYHHRPDTATPLEESMQALDHIVRQGKALYVGISNYNATQSQQAADILRQLGTPFIINQVRYNMFDRWIEEALLDTLERNGLGCIVFSPLAQGLLTEKYLNGIPEDSRAAKDHGHLKGNQVTVDKIEKVKALKKLAEERHQSINQLAIAWLLRHKGISSVLVGASSVYQIKDNVAALSHLEFTSEELERIEFILG